MSESGGVRGGILENHSGTGHSGQPGGLTRRPIGPSSRLEMIVLGLQQPCVIV